jgi:hypothetical protein
MTKETLQYIGEIHQSRCISQNLEIIVECDATLIQEHSCIHANEHGSNWKKIKRPVSTDSKAQHPNKYGNGKAPWHALAAVKRLKNSTSHAGVTFDSCHQGTDLVVEKGSGKEEANS